MKQLKIENPCTEDWTKMTGTEKKRFCASCNHQVEDFSKKSVEDILWYLESEKGQTCGRVKRSQLNPIRKIAATVMIGGLLAGACSPKISEETSSCNQQTIHSKIEMADTAKEEAVLTVKGKVKVSFKGTILLEDEGGAIGANIDLELTETDNHKDKIVKQTISEFDGTFSFETEVETEKYKNFVVVISYTGFETFEIPLENVNLKEDLKFTLALSQELHGEEVLMGFIAIPQD